MSEITLKQGAETPTRFTSTRLDDFPMPQGREEDWRFTPLDRLRDLLADSLGGPARYSVNGQSVSLDEPVTSPGMVLTLHSCGDLQPLVSPPFDRAGVVGWNNITQTLSVDIEGTCPDPIYIDIQAGGEASVGHVRVNALAHSGATVVLRHTGSGSLNETVEVMAGRDAKLMLISLQDWDVEARHVATHQLTLEQGASVKHAVLTLGGDTVRVSSGVRLPDRLSELNMLGLYFTNAEIHQENRLFIEHKGEQSKSRVAYKGALQGQDAHSVWVGDVIIGPHAYGSDSYELNRNLVLGKGPRVDSVPNLEIHNGQIEGAGHASATGRFDDEQLFYLQSRGIDPVAAKHLVVKAFYAELLNEINIQELTDHVLKLVDSHLSEGSLQ